MGRRTQVSSPPKKNGNDDVSSLTTKTPLTAYEEAAFVFIAARLPLVLKDSCCQVADLDKLCDEGGIFDVVAFLLPILTSELTECDGSSLVVVISSYTILLYLTDYIISQLHFIVDDIRYNQKEWNYKKRLCFNCFTGGTIGLSRNNKSLRFIELLWRPPSSDTTDVIMDGMALLSPFVHHDIFKTEEATEIIRHTFIYQRKGFVDLGSEPSWMRNDRLWNHYRSIYEIPLDGLGKSLNAKSKEEKKLIKLQRRISPDDHIKNTDIKWIICDASVPLSLSIEMALQQGWIARSLDLVLHAYLEIGEYEEGQLVTIKTRTELMANILASRTVATLLAAIKRERKKKVHNEWKNKGVRPCWFLPSSSLVLPGGGDCIRLRKPRYPLYYHYESGVIHTFSIYRSAKGERDQHERRNEDVILKLAILAEPGIFTTTIP